MGRRPWVIAAVAVFLLAGSSQAGINILFYGNSFTLGSGSTRSVDALVNDIALAAGQADPYTLSAAVSGQSLSYHLAYNTAVISSGLPAGQTWDYVVLQDYSTQPTHLGSVAVHRADFAAMYQTVAAHSPDVKVIGFETWARAPGHSFYTGATPSFPGGPAQMQAELREGYALSTADVNALAGAGTSRVAPVGDAGKVRVGTTCTTPTCITPTTAVRCWRRWSSTARSIATTSGTLTLPPSPKAWPCPARTGRISRVSRISSSRRSPPACRCCWRGRGWFCAGGRVGRGCVHRKTELSCM